MSRRLLLVIELGVDEAELDLRRVRRAAEEAVVRRAVLNHHTRRAQRLALGISERHLMTHLRRLRIPEAEGGLGRPWPRPRDGQNRPLDRAGRGG